MWMRSGGFVFIETYMRMDELYMTPQCMCLSKTSAFDKYNVNVCVQEMKSMFDQIISYEQKITESIKSSNITLEILFQLFLCR